MPDGFRAAKAYVEVTADLDEGRLQASARRGAEGMEKSLLAGGDRAGRGLTGVLERHGREAGTALVKATEGKVRGEVSRFVGAGSGIGEKVRKGLGDDVDRNGFKAFMGLIAHAPKAGYEAASGLVGALSQGLKGPAGPYLIAGLSAGAVVAGPLLGAVIAGGIMSGIAAAGVGAGVILAAKDPAVQHAWTQTGDKIGDILQDSAAPFRGELIKVADRATTAFQRWEPLFRQIFGNSSKLLTPFVDMVESVGDRLLPTIMTTINASRPAVLALTHGVEGTVDAVADVVDMLGDNGPEAAAGLAAAFFLVQSSIRNVGMVVNGLTEGFGWALDTGLDFVEFLISVGEKAAKLPGPFGAMGRELAGLRPVTEGWRSDWEGLKGQIQGATDVGSQGTSKLSERTQLLSLSMGAAIQKAGSLSEAFKLLNGGALSAREAEAAYQEAIDNVSASIKENGKTLDLHTAKGRANDAAIRQLIQTTDQKAQATYDEVYATKGAEAAQAAASRVYEQGRAQLVKNLTQILGNKAAAEKMASSIMAIPKSWSTTVAVKDNATGTVSVIKKAIGSVQGKTVYVTVVERVQKNGDIHVSGKGGSGTQVKGAATGGEITGGSGWKDDVPLLTMGGEWVIRKAAVSALKRQFGPDFMQQLNTWDQGGRGGPAPKLGTRGGGGEPSTMVRAAPSGGGGGQVINIGTITLDASRMRSLADVLELINGLTMTARAQRARTVTVAGR